MPESERFFFVHLQKTGGTALFQRLRDAFGDEAVYPWPEDKGEIAAVLDVEFLQQRFAERRDQLRVITGHFPLCMVDVLGGPFTTFTLLRDPVERTLSALRRRQATEAHFEGMSLEEIYDDADLRVVLTNHMVKMLSLTPEEMTSTPLLAPVTFDDARLERALHHLTTIDVVGLQEHFDEFCRRLELRLGRPLGAARFANRTRAQPVDVDLRARIAADNAHDIALYQRALGLLGASGGTPLPST